MSAYDTFSAAADTHALKVVLEGEPMGHAPVIDAEADAAINGDVAALVAEDRIEIEFGELRQVDGESRETMEEVAECLPMKRRSTSEAGDQSAEWTSPDEFGGVRIGEGRERERDSAEEFCLDAAETDSHERPEDRGLRHADEELRAGQHRLDEDRTANARRCLLDGGEIA